MAQKRPLPPFSSQHNVHKATFNNVLTVLGIDIPFILTAEFKDDICPYSNDKQDNSSSTTNQNDKQDNSSSTTNQKCIFQEKHAKKKNAVYFFGGNIHSYYKRYFRCSQHSPKKLFYADNPKIKWK